MGAGLEHLFWAGGTVRHVDLLLVVVEPNRKTMLTAARTDRLARQLAVAQVALVANRTANSEDEQRMRSFAAELGRELLVVVPEDDAVTEADRSGRCVLDMAPDAPTVQAVEALARIIENHPVASPASSDPSTD